MSIEDEAHTERIMSERIARYREAACDALGGAGWEINSEDELDEALQALVGQASRKVEAAPSDTELGALLARWDDMERPDGWNAGDEHHLADLLITALRSASQPVEVTDEMVEKAALSILNRMMWPSLHWPKLDVLHNRDVRMAMARAALVAALGGGE